MNFLAIDWLCFRVSKLSCVKNSSNRANFEPRSRIRVIYLVWIDYKVICLIERNFKAIRQLGLQKKSLPSTCFVVFVIGRGYKAPVQETFFCSWSLIFAFCATACVVLYELTKWQFSIDVEHHIIREELNYSIPATNRHIVVFYEKQGSFVKGT